nr:transposase [Burkholderia pyrrocinia]
MLDKLQQAARENAIRLLYLDEAGFCGSPPVQRSWSPQGLPHEIEPNTHCRRSVLGALDYGANLLIHATHARSIKGPTVVRFIDDLLAVDDDRPTVIVLDNASIHHVRHRRSDTGSVADRSQSCPVLSACLQSGTQQDRDRVAATEIPMAALRHLDQGNHRR